MARISGAGGVLVVPANTPYERELLIEHVDAYAKQHGWVRLEFDRGECEVPVGVGEAPACSSCHRRLDKLAFWLDRRTTCDQCAAALR